MIRSFVPPLILVMTLLTVAPTGYADDPPAISLDAREDPTIYATHFGRYGKYGNRIISIRDEWVRFRLPGLKQPVDQTGLYSYFALAGDFEVTADFAVLTIPKPTKGYGACLGLAIETETTDGGVYLTRTFNPDGGSGYVVTRMTMDEYGKRDYKGIFWESTKAKQGRFRIRREGEEIICYTADTWDGTFKELKRIEFPETTIRTVRIYGDTGNSPTPVDGYVGRFQVQAGEITGGIPEQDEPPDYDWIWPATFSTFGLGIIGYALYRRRKLRREEEEE